MCSLIGASAILPMNDENAKSLSVIRNGAIAYENGKIVEIGEFDNLSKKYTNATFYQSCVLLPAFINPHIHFEFSSHLCEFEYGDFGRWLDSLMQKRDDLFNENLNKAMQEALDSQLHCGVGSVGAISSYGLDLEILADSALKVVHFSEILGSNPSAIDFLYSNFLQRIENALKFKSYNFTPAVALHSPYSLHPVLAKRAINKALELDSPLSVHFLESKHELEWLEQGSGYFKGFLSNIGIKNPAPLYTPQSFLDMLLPIAESNLPLSLTHCLYADNYLQSLKNLNATIISCPKSNRLLNNKILDVFSYPAIAFGTDGKSSNNNVNLLDELRVALFSNSSANLQSLVNALLLGATRNAAKSLGLNNGILEFSKDADFALFKFDKAFFESSDKNIALNMILHATKAHKLIINGNTIF